MNPLKSSDLSQVVVPPNTWEAEAGGALCVQGLPGVQNSFQDRQGYKEKHFVSKNQKKKKVF